MSRYFKIIIYTLCYIIIYTFIITLSSLPFIFGLYALINPADAIVRYGLLTIVTFLIYFYSFLSISNYLFISKNEKILEM